MARLVVRLRPQPGRAVLDHRGDPGRGGAVLVAGAAGGAGSGGGAGAVHCRAGWAWRGWRGQAGRARWPSPAPGCWPTSRGSSSAPAFPGTPGQRLGVSRPARRRVHPAGGLDRRARPDAADRAAGGGAGAAAGAGAAVGALGLAAWIAAGVVRLHQPMPAAAPAACRAGAGQRGRGAEMGPLADAVDLRALSASQPRGAGAGAVRAPRWWSGRKPRVHSCWTRTPARDGDQRGDGRRAGAGRRGAVRQRPPAAQQPVRAGGQRHDRRGVRQMASGAVRRISAGWLPLGVQVVPGGGFARGPGPRTLHVPGLPPVGPLICYEAIFSGQVVDEADRPDWLVNVTNDAWFGNSTGPRQHLAAARMRAVEEGLPLMRAANTGITAGFRRERPRTGAAWASDRAGSVVVSLPAGVAARQLFRPVWLADSGPCRRCCSAVHGLLVAACFSAGLIPSAAGLR